LLFLGVRGGFLGRFLVPLDFVPRFLIRDPLVIDGAVIRGEGGGIIRVDVVE